jgi:hypothetical protein
MTDRSYEGVRATAKVSDIQNGYQVDSWLTDYSVGFRQEASMFISGRASTNIPVRLESAKFPVFPRGYFWRDESQVRPLGGRPAQVGYKIGSDTYLAEEWALETTIDDRERANIDFFVNPDETGVELLEQKQLIREDRIWAAEFFQTGVWAHEEIGGTDFTPFNDAASTPIEVIDRLKNEMALSTGMMPNTMVVGANVKPALRSNADIVDRIKYTQRGVADDALLAALFEVQNFMVARSVYNAADETTADDGGLDMEWIADPNAIWLGYIAPTGGMKTPTAIARFGWTGLIPGATNNSGGVITRGRDGRAYTDWIHSRMAFDLKAVSVDLGIFITNANIPVSN